LGNLKVTYMQTAIKHQWFYACQPQLVWDYLTNPELLAQWIMKNDIKPEVGHKFTFKTKAIPEMEFDGIVYCEILESVPLKKLSYSWNLGPGDGQITVNSVVTWTLIPGEKGTDLFLEHTGFGALSNKLLVQGMDAGWKKNMTEALARLITKQQADEAVRG
jgi:uncharacterized protein YndB with AHSA1/START domain